MLTPKRSVNWSFYAGAFLAVVLGVATIFSATHFIQQQEVKHVSMESTPVVIAFVVRDIGIALLVAAVSVLALEKWVHEKSQKELRDGVFSAVISRMSTERVFQELKEQIFDAKLIKQNWRTNMNLFEDPIGSAAQGFMFSETSVDYDVQNLSESVVEHSIVIRLDQDVDTPANALGTYPEIRSVSVNDIPIEGQKFKDAISDNGYTFQSARRLQPREKIGVRIVLREPIKIPDTFVWVTRPITHGAELSYSLGNIQGIEFEVALIHPSDLSRHPSAPASSDSLKHEGVLLPFQGFRIATRRAGTGRKSTPVKKRMFGIFGGGKRPAVQASVAPMSKSAAASPPIDPTQPAALQATTTEARGDGNESG